MHNPSSQEQKGTRLTSRIGAMQVHERTLRTVQRGAIPGGWVIRVAWECDGIAEGRILVPFNCVRPRGGRSDDNGGMYGVFGLARWFCSKATHGVGKLDSDAIRPC